MQEADFYSNTLNWINHMQWICYRSGRYRHVSLYLFPSSPSVWSTPWQSPTIPSQSSAQSSNFVRARKINRCPWFNNIFLQLMLFNGRLSLSLSTIYFAIYLLHLINAIYCVHELRFFILFSKIVLIKRTNYCGDHQAVFSVEKYNGYSLQSILWISKVWSLLEKENQKNNWTKIRD